MNKTFKFDSKQYTYETGEYNNARLNERAVEVPIAAKLLSTHNKVLEVGNVLSHYGYEVEMVMDMGSEGDYVKSEDVISFNLDGIFDCAICIGVLAHLNVDAALKIVEYTKASLKPGSPYLFTIPHGYNANVDMALTVDAFHTDYIYRMDKKDGELHTWKQEIRRFGEIKDLAYNGKSQWANTLYILSGNTPDEDELAGKYDFKNISDPQG